MMPSDELDECEKCNGEIDEVDFGEYISYKCSGCGFSPIPPEET
jgi:hypothetical protein